VLAELAAEAEQIESPAEMLLAQVRDRIEQECRTALRQLDAELAMALERDRLMALRPTGCVCLGVGGTGHLLPFVSYVLWSTWCVCPESLAQQAEAARVDAEICAEREQDEARRAAAEQAERLHRANLPVRLAGLTFADFQGDPGKETALAAIRALAPGGPNRGVYLYGGVGTGKTTLAALAVRHWVQDGGAALFLTISELFDMLRPGGREMAEEVAESQAALMQRLLSTGLLVLDDMGTERVTGWSRERLFLVINRRYDAGRLTIMTSNFSLGLMAKRLAGTDEPVEGNRIAWRIQETCELIELGGENYRDRSSRGARSSSQTTPRQLAAAGARLPYADDSVEELPL
jgi:DNA replication protein DnaC